MGFTVLVAASIAALTPLTSASAVIGRGMPFGNLGGLVLSSSNHYGAPQAPWESGSTPGWFYSHQGGDFGSFPSLTNTMTCKVINMLPSTLHCPQPSEYPPPQDDYQQSFHDLKGATQASDYLTYGLVDTVADCQVMCDSVDGCIFFNTYHDNNSQNGKDARMKLTCSLFSKCHDKMMLPM